MLSDLNLILDPSQKMSYEHICVIYKILELLQLIL